MVTYNAGHYYYHNTVGFTFSPLVHSTTALIFSAWITYLQPVPKAVKTMLDLQLTLTALPASIAHACRNELGIQARNQALHAALSDLDAFLGSHEGQVVIFDATNTTEERRRVMVCWAPQVGPPISVVLSVNSSGNFSFFCILGGTLIAQGSLTIQKDKLPYKL